MSWWKFGDYSGYDGADLQLHRLICPFCGETDNFELVSRNQKKKMSGDKVLNYDTYSCGNCSNLVMVFWSANNNKKIHNFHQLPWPTNKIMPPEEWPHEVSHLWKQAKSSLKEENYDAAVLMARSALQVALRTCDAQGNNLKSEIDYLASKQLLPPIMKEWADELRFLGNEGAHPKPGNTGINPADAKDVVRFLDFLLEYLFTLPQEINAYRTRRKEGMGP